MLSFFRYVCCCFVSFIISHLLGLRALLAAEQNVAKVHQVGQQGVALLTLADQVAAARVPGRQCPAGHHFIPAGRAAAHRRRNHSVERSRHGIYDVRGGRSAWSLSVGVF